MNICDKDIIYNNFTLEIKEIILPVFLYDCEAWSLALKEEVVFTQDSEANIWAQEG